MLLIFPQHGINTDVSQQKQDPLCLYPAYCMIYTMLSKKKRNRDLILLRGVLSCLWVGIEAGFRGGVCRCGGIVVAAQPTGKHGYQQSWHV